MSHWSQIISHLTVLHDFLVKKQNKTDKNKYIHNKSRPQEIIKACKETLFYGTHSKCMDISPIFRRAH